MHTSCARPAIPLPPAFKVSLTASSYDVEVAAACKQVKNAAGSLSDFPVLAANTANKYQKRRFAPKEVLIRNALRRPGHGN